MKNVFAIALMLVSLNIPQAFSLDTNINKKISMDTIETNSSSQFYEIRNMLMKKTLMSSDFSEVNLSKNFTMKSYKGENSNMETDPNKCGVIANMTEQVIYRHGKAHIIRIYSDYQIINDVNCENLLLGNVATVESYNIPSKEEYKKLFIKTVAGTPFRGHYTEEETSKSIVFTILDDGFSYIDPRDGEPVEYRERKITNPMKGRYSQYDYEEYGVNLSASELSASVILSTDYNTPYIGIYSQSGVKNTEGINNSKYPPITVADFLKEKDVEL